MTYRFLEIITVTGFLKGPNSDPFRFWGIWRSLEDIATKMRDAVARQTSVTVENFSQVCSAVSEEMRREQTDRMTDK